MKIIGRKEQVSELLSFTKSEQSEFVAIYGRRRVGKTFLIKNLFEKQMAFSFTALANGTNLQQLASFQIVMQEFSGQQQE
ncbi:MAG: ATP-binding protein, partial [Bacteroidales bacterium]|nr:ATP-binding protein [Bacteroidales bacterium]